MSLISGLIVDAVTRVLAGAGGTVAGGKVVGWLRDKAEREAFDKSLDRALTELGKKYPSLKASLFDKTFIEGPIAVELAALFKRHKSPSPDVISEKYAAQFSVTPGDVRGAADFFLRTVEACMKDEKVLQDLLNRRQTEQSNQLLGRLDENVGLILGIVRKESVIEVLSDMPTEAATRALEQASSALLHWPKTLDGQLWIERPEIEVIESMIASQDPSIVMLLGPPGSGKSALLSKLGELCITNGYSVIGIKADQLPEWISSLADLDKHLNLTRPLADELRALARQKKVVLLIDQLDALGDLVDVHTGRLSTLIALIRELSGGLNLHLVCSCRTFERTYDARLTQIEAKDIHLTALPWERVSQILKAHGFKPEGWPEEFRSILCYPQCLKLFVKHYVGSSEAAVFETYQAMLEHLWHERLFKRTRHEKASKLLNKIATDMAEEEMLFAPTARFDHDAPSLNYLVSQGILQYDETRRQISFSHQSLFDFARARAFVSQVGLLSKFAIERQTALSVRPKVWSALVYLRATDGKAYRVEFEALWKYPHLRRHLRLLLIDLIGMQEKPLPFEIQAFHETAVIPDLVANAFRAIAGRKAWFEEIKADLLPRMMVSAVKEGWPARLVLQQAWPFARDEVLQLLEKYWTTDKEKRDQAYRTLQSLAAWDRRSTNLAIQITSDGSFRNKAIGWLASTISASQPELAIKFVAASINRQLREALANEPTNPTVADDASDEGKQIAATILEPRKVLRDILDRPGTEWFALLEMVEAAPVTWIEEMWPRVRQALETLSYLESTMLCQYRGDAMLGTAFEGDDESKTNREFPILDSTVLAIRAFARQQPERYIEFTKINAHSDVAAVQRLLAIGLSEIGTTHPKEGLSYLLVDRRRLQLGNVHFGERETKMLARAIFPHLDEQERKHFEQYVLSAKTIRDDIEVEDATTRRERQKQDRLFRLRILTSLPQEYLSETTRKLIRTESQSAFPNFKDKRNDIESYSSSSTMKSEQMKKAKDNELLEFLREYPDSTEWGEIFERRSGSIDVSRAFGEFAKMEPVRALKIMTELDPSTHQRPVGYGLQEIPKESMSMEGFAEIVLKFEKKGFNSSEFREPVTNALKNRITHPNGLPDSMVTLLIQWLREVNVGSERKVEVSDKDEEREDSVLWGHGGVVVHPSGAYPLLSTIYYGLVFREAVPHELLFEVLGQHLERNDAAEIWNVFLWDLSKYVGRCNPALVQEFVDRVLDKYPDLISSKATAMLVAYAIHVVSGSAIERWLSLMWAAGGTKARQACGEILLLCAIIKPEETWATKKVDELVEETFRGNSEVQEAFLGLVQAAVHLWSEIDDKTAANRVLEKGMFSTYPPTGRAALEWFRLNERARPTPESLPVFRATAEGNAIASSQHFMFLVEALMEAVQDEPDLVYRMCKKILDSSGADMANLLTSVSSDAEGIVDIAFALQRMDEPHRTNGLVLFEQMLNYDAAKAQRALVDVDRRPGNSVPDIPRRSRRPGRRRKGFSGII